MKANAPKGAHGSRGRDGAGTASKGIAASLDRADEIVDLYKQAESNNDWRSMRRLLVAFDRENRMRFKMRQVHHALDVLAGGTGIDSRQMSIEQAVPGG